MATTVLVGWFRVCSINGTIPQSKISHRAAGQLRLDEQTKKASAPITDNTSREWVSNVSIAKGHTRYYGLVRGLRVKK
jgi:hypothetical protein